ncbi:MAG: deoxyribodipyrimidine photo-lyase [Gemmatimonadota bacterium]|nr:deoxyribodipyrimidine photo-lyase [Gemmatimonadota bacterium]
MSHPLGSPYVTEQLSMRAQPRNDRPLVATKSYVLYWMQSTQRFEDNWALRLAIREADRINKPLLVVQTIDCGGDPHTSSRFHTFVLQGAQELAARAALVGLTYRLLLIGAEREGDRHLRRVAESAALIVTDDFPTEGVSSRIARLATYAACRVISVDSVGVVAAGCFEREEYSARTLRPKLDRALAIASEPVEDRAPKRGFLVSLLPDVPFTSLDASDAELARIVERCGVATYPGPVALRGGLTPARARLLSFVTQALPDYSRRRTNPSDAEGTSRLSPYLHYGMISPLEVMRTARDSGAGLEYDAFAEEMLTWRALSQNLCVRNPAFASLASAPAWAHRSMEEHANDPRPEGYTLETLELAKSDDPVWNAGQRELMATGTMHPLVRMLWGKAVVAWAPTYQHAFDWLVHLNNKYSLDGRDPASYAGVLWCFGKFDRPFVTRPGWGSIRPMSLARARARHDVEEYIERWSGGSVAMVA